MNAAVAAQHGARQLAFVSGDQGLVNEVHELSPAIPVAVVKHALTVGSARHLSPKQARDIIESGVAAALTGRCPGQLCTIQGPITVDVQFALPRHADQAATAPGIDRAAPTRVRIDADDAIHAYRWGRTALMLAHQPA